MKTLLVSFGIITLAISVMESSNILQPAANNVEPAWQGSAPPFQSLMTLSTPNPQFTIPGHVKVSVTGYSGLSIRPPQQPVHLLNGDTTCSSITSSPSPEAYTYEGDNGHGFVLVNLGWKVQANENTITVQLLTDIGHVTYQWQGQRTGRLDRTLVYTLLPIQSNNFNIAGTSVTVQFLD